MVLGCCIDCAESKCKCSQLPKFGPRGFIFKPLLAWDDLFLKRFKKKFKNK